jgi:MinD superfamily P-loop ATPase
MKKPVEIAVVSAKGGEGRTLVASSLGKLTDSTIIADCDVAAPNMHLLLKPSPVSEGVFLGDKHAVLNMGLCNQCGECFKACRFDAVREGDVPEGWLYSIDTLACEGCGVCTRICPQGALELTSSAAGTWYVSRSALGPLVHASLSPGQRNPDGLVRILRREARRVAGREGRRLIVVDAPAGTGAAAMAALAGADMALVVAEPTVSGTHGLRRVIDLAQRHDVAPVCVINKHDVDPGITADMEEYLGRAGVPLIGKIPFSREVSEAVRNLRFAVDLADDPAAGEIGRVGDRVRALVDRYTQQEV